MVGIGRRAAAYQTRLAGYEFAVVLVAQTDCLGDRGHLARTAYLWIDLWALGGFWIWSGYFDLNWARGGPWKAFWLIAEPGKPAPKFASTSSASAVTLR
jgi:hypothetical protein